MTERGTLTLSEAGRLLGKSQRRYEMHCQECGVAIVGTSRRKWCSTRCAVRAWRRAHRQDTQDTKKEAATAP